MERYYDRLSKHDISKSNSKHHSARKISSLDRLSYEEISIITTFLSSSDAENFRHLSKQCNYSACFGILSNLKSFQSLLESEDYKRNQGYLKDHLPTTIDDLIKFEVKFSDSDLENYVLYINNSAVKEILHLVLRYALPSNKKVKFEMGDFRKNLLGRG